MSGRHEEIVRLSAWPTKVEAALYNLARRGMARLGGELRLPMRGLKTLDLIVQDDAWIIVDRSLNDLPVAAWVGFDAGPGRALHQPVACELRYYHGHAGLVIKKVLRRMEEDLTALLAGEGAPGGEIIPFRGRES